MKFQIKKIAFIGCSHFSAFETGAGQGKDSWTWQLAEKFPHHLYRNYSIGGRGLEYFQWCIMDAKKWGANIVFVNKTYTGRWGLLGQFDENAPSEFVWDLHVIDSKWSEVYLKSAHVWGSQGSNHVNGNLAPYLKRSVETALDVVTEVSIANELRKSYEYEWYKIAPSMYNFDDFFLVHWAPDNEDYPESLSNFSDTTVVDMLRAEVGCNHEHELYPYGITLAEDDNHLTHKGHKLVLDKYILSSEKVRNALTSTE